MLNENFVIIKIDTDEMDNGQQVADSLGGAGKGLPWCTVLDSDGKELINSDGPGGNIGCPVGEDEQAHFIKMLQSTGPAFSPEQIEILARALADYAVTLH